MNGSPSPSEQIAASMIKLAHIQHLREREFVPTDQILHGIVIFYEGKGSVEIGGHIHRLEPLSAVYAAPGLGPTLRVQPGSHAEYDYIQFYALRIAERHRFEPQHLRLPAVRLTGRVASWREKLRELARKLGSGNGWDVLQANIDFQHMIADIWRETAHAERLDLAQAIQMTLDYMERNYRNQITRKQLADMAGVSEDYYSRAFKKQVGKSPMAYLTEIRMNRAKQLLIQPGASLRSIAHHTGFSDEFYFSRKFKAETGCSPMTYVKQIKYSCRIASLNHLSTGNLLALNIEPYAAVMNNAFPVVSRLANTISVGSAAPDLEKLLEAKPDLIVMHNTLRKELSPKERMLNQIAPTVSLPYLDDWREHLRTIAGIIGKDKEAEAWLDRYESKAAFVRSQIEARTAGETVLILGIGEGRMCLYGRRNIGAVLYGDLKLGVPDGVADIVHYMEITAEELLHYDADRIVLTSYKHDGSERTDRAIREASRRLFADPQWKSHRAVANKKVYALLDGRHLYTSYNALTHDLLLDKAYRLFVLDRTM